MDEKERIRKVAEKYAGELDKVLKDVSRELDHAAIKLEQVGGRVYDNLPKEAKDAEKDLRRIAGSMIDDVRKDLPKLQKGVEQLGRKLDKALADLQKAAQKKP
jgi:division protein CdvB (Snf7/Vps24/ESCRT-III family)